MATKSVNDAGHTTPDKYGASICLELEYPHRSFLVEICNNISIQN